MIEAVEYVTDGGRIVADKLMSARDAWHMKGIRGNGLAPTTALGSSTYGLPGKGYEGIHTDSREIDVEIYADAQSPWGLQRMVDELSRVLTASNAALGALRLRNAGGGEFRIPARCTSFDAEAVHRRSALYQVVFECPQPFFEDGASTIMYLAPASGGMTWPVSYPSDFGNATNASATRLQGSQTVINAGDIAAPALLRLNGTGLTAATVTNETTGASIVVTGVGGAYDGIEIDTDADKVGATFADGTDAARYVSMLSDISDFKIIPGENVISYDLRASSVDIASSALEFRGRYTTCL